MQASKVKDLPVYTVWDGQKTRRGMAHQILDGIKNDAGRDSAIRRMGLDEYATVLVEDASYFIPTGELRFLEGQPYESKFDQALQYLAAMPSSGVRILQKQ